MSDYKPNLINDDFFKSWNMITHNSIDLILTDPPYGALSELHSWDRLPDFHEIEKIFNKLLSPIGQLIVFADLNLLIMIKGIFTNYFNFRFYFIWEKPGGMPISRNRPIPNTEFILVFRKKGALEKDLVWNPQLMGETGAPYKKINYTKDIAIRRKKKSRINNNYNGQRFPKTIITAPSKPNMLKSEKSVHPTQKPELLLRKIIKGFTNTGDTILDPFAGSGSTLISAFKEDRKSIGFEIENFFYHDAKKRIKCVTSQTNIFSK